MKLLEPVIISGYLRIFVIVGQFGDMCGVPHRRIVIAGFPQTQMLQYFIDYLPARPKYCGSPETRVSIDTMMFFEILFELWRVTPQLGPPFVCGIR